MLESELRQNFLTLVRQGIGHNSSILSKPNWQAIKALAERQGLLAIVLDGIEKLPANQRPPQETLLQWIGETLQDYENRYNQYCKAIAKLAAFYNSHGHKMMVLKGYACSLDWPKPEHRPCGDIDIWQFGEYEEADEALRKEGTVIDNSHHHHTVFEWHGFTVENHYDFINVHHHKSHVALENILKDLGKDDTHHVELYGERVYLPSPNLHALFLLKHLLLHFSTGEMTVRQLLDWAFFVEKHTKEVDWDWLGNILDENNIRTIFNTINAICVEDCGFSPNIFPYVQYNPFLKERVLKDIFEPQYAGEIPVNLFARLLWKIRRWKANSWKHELCYKDSMWSAFWSGVWNHLLKPASI